MQALATDTGETVILMRMIGRAAVCVHRVQSAQRLRIEYEPGATLPIERGASGKLLLAGLTPQARKDLLAPLAQRDPDAAALLEARVARAAQQGFATSEEEIYQGVWAASAAVVQGKRTLAALTVPSPLVRASAEERKQLLDQVRAAAARINTELRAARR
jgi:DNA-binding IclR family transcriptional regulator